MELQSVKYAENLSFCLCPVNKKNKKEVSESLNAKTL